MDGSQTSIPRLLFLFLSFFPRRTENKQKEKQPDGEDLHEQLHYNPPSIFSFSFSFLSFSFLSRQSFTLPLSPLSPTARHVAPSAVGWLGFPLLRQSVSQSVRRSVGRSKGRRATPSVSLSICPPSRPKSEAFFWVVGGAFYIN